MNPRLGGQAFEAAEQLQAEFALDTMGTGDRGQRDAGRTSPGQGGGGRVSD
jgi:hypothetical protein